MTAGLQKLGLLAATVASVASVSFAAENPIPPKSQPEPMIISPENDPDLIKAEQEARRTLPMFWQLLALHPEYSSAFSVKAGFDTDMGFVDYLWLVNLKRDGDKVTGVLDNEPDGLPNLHVGDTVRVDEARIIDWLLAVDDRQYGHFTTRVLLKRDAKMAEQLKNILSSEPLPPGFKDVPVH